MGIPTEYFRLSGAAPTHPQLIRLTDGDNAYSLVSLVRPKYLRRLTKINLEYIRDSRANGLLSFIDDGANISDVGAKINGSGDTTRRYCNTGICRISILRRESSGILKDIHAKSSGM